MTKRSERFRARRAMLAARSGGAPLSVVDDRWVEDLLSQDVDWALINSVAVEVPVFDQYMVTDEAIDRCLADLDKSFSQKKYDALYDGVKCTLIDTLLGPLRLSRSDIMEYDRKYVYGDVKQDYNVTEKTRNDLWKGRQSPDGTVTDAYTGQKLGKGRADLDHVIPKKKIHDRGGYALDPDERQGAGNDPDNLQHTDRSINRSKQDKDLGDVPNTDKGRTKPIQERANKAVEGHLPSKWQIARRGMKEGIGVGKQQGLQQAIGLLIAELTSAVFFEVKDILYRGWKGERYDFSWVEVLKGRLDRVRRRLLARWQDVAVAFGKGWLAGFLSATMTMVLNTLVRTGRNVVRIIREGFLSLVNAIQVLLFPPAGMSLGEAAHEASKVLLTGLVVTGGILAGEAIGQFFKFPGGELLASTVGGLIAGLGSLFVVFMLDKLDLFGVVFDERHSFIMGKLEDRTAETIRKIDSLATELGLTESSGSPGG